MEYGTGCTRHRALGELCTQEQRGGEKQTGAHGESGRIDGHRGCHVGPPLPVPSLPAVAALPFLQTPVNECTN